MFKRIASLERIERIRKISDSKNLELVEFEDCDFISRKGNFKSGQIVFVIRAGSILPKNIAKSINKLRLVKSNKVRKLILRGTISDCIIVPLNEVFSLLSEYRTNPKKYLGIDLAEQLRIQHDPLDCTGRKAPKEDNFIVKFFKKYWV
jgi:hypothetical protein